jgi:hypothetical protein
MAAAPTPALADTRSVTLAWTAPGDDGWIGRAQAYDLRFSRNPITDSNFGFATRINTSILPGPTGAKEVLTIFNLTYGIAYYFAVKTMDEVGNWSRVSNVAYAPAGVADVDGLAPAKLEFAAPRPNPARGRASFAVSLPQAEWLRVEAFDVTGRKVKTVAMGEYAAGSFDLTWDLRDDLGRPLQTGNYLVRGQVGENVFLRRVSVMR